MMPAFILTVLLYIVYVEYSIGLMPRFDTRYGIRRIDAENSIRQYGIKYNVRDDMSIDPRSHYKCDNPIIESILSVTNLGILPFLVKCSLGIRYRSRYNRGFGTMLFRLRIRTLEIQLLVPHLTNYGIFYSGIFFCIIR